MDFGWKFTLGDPPGAEKPKFDDSSWRKLDVPHDWSIEGPWAKDNPSGRPGGFAPIGIGWYRKTFRVPQDFAGTSVRLDFDGVFDHADVWINGNKVGHNEYGYIGFECDLSPWIRAGHDNVIALRVDDLRQASRWYTGSGIYRHVWLVVSGPMHIAHWGTFVTTPRVTASQADVEVRTTLCNDSDEKRTGAIITRIISPAGTQVGEVTTPFELAAWSKKTLSQQAAVKAPELWTLDQPRMYRTRSEIHDATAVADAYETPFGIRTIRFDVNNGFNLNGKRVIIKGVCLHDDLGALGTADFAAGYAYRLKVLKTIGVNAIRLSHDAHAPELLDLADRMGFLVFDEAFDKWYGFLPDGTGWKDDLIATIERDRNHPSVFIWSVGNEMTPHMYMRLGTRLYQAMQNVVHEIDPTRPVTAALHPVRNSHGERDAPLAEIASYMDVISMNYQTRFYTRDHEQHPNQVLLGSEVHLHQVNLNTPRPASDNSGNQWWGTRDYATGKYFPYVAGQFIWAGVDYLGESEGWPSKGYRTTLVSMTGVRKPWSYFIQSLYTDEPMVYIAVDNPDFAKQPKRDAGGNFVALRSDWNLPADLPTARVYTFTNVETVELLLNGKSLGTKRAADYADHIILWDVPNQPGTVTAIARSAGKEVARYEIQSAGAPVKLQLVPDRSTVDATGQDLSFVSVEAVDANGHIVPGAADKVTCEVSGPGTLAAVDNADLDSPEVFKTNQRRLYGGRALAIVQSARETGTIHLVAHADNFPAASIDISVRAPAETVPAL